MDFPVAGKVQLVGQAADRTHDREWPSVLVVVLLGEKRSYGVSAMKSKEDPFPFLK